MNKPVAKLKLYNSLSNSLEDFTPIDEKNVRLYLCGPTVYASPHIGNARPLIVFDVMYRLLKRLYDNNVTYVRNITDVDDKINEKAKAENISIGELTTAVTEEFHKNLKLLNVLPVTHEPRATNHIAEMLEIIEKLIENGFAYEAEGHVLFRVKKLSQYGMLSKRSLDDMIAGSRVEIAAYKEDPMDFVLWKPSEANDPSWSSKYGDGRPGWHIECSAMSHKYLGEQFDIHGGGQDLMFPHHENELAQNFGAFGCLMAKYWIHNGMLLVDNQKMSKSLRNIISLDDILKKYDGEVIRYVLLSAHYQKTLNWTDQAVTQSLQSLNRLYGALQRDANVTLDPFSASVSSKKYADCNCNVEAVSAEVMHVLQQPENACGATAGFLRPSESLNDGDFYVSRHPEERSDVGIQKNNDTSSALQIQSAYHSEGSEALTPVRHALCANLNTPLALKYLHDIADRIYKSSDQNEINELCDLLRSEADVLGLLQKSCNSWFKSNLSGMDENEIQQLISERQEAKSRKDFKRADEIRARLLDNNIQIEDTKDGTKWRSI
ncbi:hypothetical protein FACS1894122_06460 [Alphaproteobacteria bacterium]|nr:hypothetical protein FACS1894122_06460 [Alphaproteobacteria bacterium]